MLKALSTSATGLQAQQANIDRISNDMANVNTDGYKRSRIEFEDLMYETIKEAGGNLGANTQTPVGIQSGSGVKVGASHKVFEQGPTRMTYHPFDLAIEGDGFFRVQRANGEVAFTRNGTFRRDSEGRLVLRNGEQMMPQITIPSNGGSPTVSPSGLVQVTLATGEQVTVGQLELFKFQNEEGLSAMGGGLLRQTLASGAPIQGIPGENGFGDIQQGAVEGSNVNIANSMVDMITTQRAYEMGTKVMSTADHMLGATVNLK
jgi:flagellar basal-body rod protein FlgG